MRDGRMRNDAWSYSWRSDDRLELFIGSIVGENQKHCAPVGCAIVEAAASFGE
jgi:hypothetical protein